MNDTDVQATNTDCRPKLHKNYKLVLQSDVLIKGCSRVNKDVDQEHGHTW